MNTKPLWPLALLSFLAACGSSPRETKPAAPAAPIAVSTVAAAAQQWPAIYETTGTVRARTSTVVAARLMGYIREVKVREGERVNAGQLLVTIDARELDVNSSQATASLDEVRSAVPEAESALLAAQANLDLAQSTFGRMQELFGKRSISSQEFDEASAKLKAAQAAFEMARARRAQIDIRAARVQQQVRATEVARSYAEVTAPFAGIVTAKTAEPGTMAMPGAPLLTIEREGAYRLEAAVEESRLATIRVGQAASVALDGVELLLAARVGEIAPVVDAASRSYTVKLDLPPSAALRSGLFGRASFALGGRQVLTIPAGAVKQNGQLQSVMVAEDSVARTRLISVGETARDQTEVLSGLTAGEKIIFPVPRELTDGAPVEVRP